MLRVATKKDINLRNSFGENYSSMSLKKCPQNKSKKIRNQAKISQETSVVIKRHIMYT